MCFSAASSFGSSFVLAVAAVITLKNVRTPSQIPFAAIPILFSIQQVAEGLLWLNVPDSTNQSLIYVSTYGFLSFAMVVWPTWVPLSVLLFAQNKQRTRSLYALLLLGSILSLHLGILLFWYGATAHIVGHHIYYEMSPFNQLSMSSSVCYGIVTIVPTFLSGSKKMWVFGFTTSITYIVTMVFYEYYAISVWCFFSAVMSILVYAILKESNNNRRVDLQEQEIISAQFAAV